MRKDLSIRGSFNNYNRGSFNKTHKYYRIQSFLSIRHVHGDLCKHLGIDSSSDPEGMSVFTVDVLYITHFKC